MAAWLGDLTTHASPLFPGPGSVDVLISGGSGQGMWSSSATCTGVGWLRRRTDREGKALFADLEFKRIRDRIIRVALNERDKRSWDFRLRVLLIQPPTDHLWHLVPEA